MRSRFSAFAVGDPVYLLASWHQATRPATLELDPDLEWRRLDILEASDDRVTFVAHFWDAARRLRGEQREDSLFAHVDGQWFYVGPADR